MLGNRRVAAGLKTSKTVTQNLRDCLHQPALLESDHVLPIDHPIRRSRSFARSNSELGHRD